MRRVTQGNLARELKVSDMTISRLMRSLRRTELPLTDLDITKAFICDELQSIGIDTNQAIELVLEFEADILSLVNNNSLKCWIVFVCNQKKNLKFQRLMTVN